MNRKPSNLLNTNTMKKLILYRKYSIAIIFFFVAISSYSQPTLLKDINLGTNNGNPTYAFKFNNELLFSAQDTNGNMELWKTDGTTVGTVLLKEIRQGTTGSNPSGYIEMNGIMYFVANDGIHGSELWKTDGTEIGTVLVKDINPYGGNANIGNYAIFNNELYFVADSATNNLSELWKTNGTENGTVLVKSFRPLSYYSSYTSNLIVSASGNELFFMSDDGPGFYLWKTDGTTAGTIKVKSLINSPYNKIGLFLNLNSFTYFTAYNSSGKQSLWRTDGTTNGTIIFYNDISISSLSNNEKIVYNNKFYFSANDQLSSGTELWSSDGTLAGTQMVKDIKPGIVSSFPKYFFELNNELYFQVSTSPGLEMWKTNGTEAGTQFIVDVNPGFVNSILAATPIQELNKFYFTGDDGTQKILWESNGTTAGTFPLYNLSESGIPLVSRVSYLNNKLFFTKETAATGIELWSFNPTLSSSDIVLNDNLKVYPNPVSNILNVETLLIGNYQLKIVNQLGQVVLEQKQNSSTSSIDVSNLLKGLYFLVITSENTELQTVKFIKK